MDKERRMKPTQIKKMKGVLCKDIWGKVFLRSTEPDGSERDYRIEHCDLSVEVTDEDLYAYFRDGEWVLDYSPATLGTPEKSTDNE